MNPLRAFNWLLAVGIAVEYAALMGTVRGMEALGLAPVLVWTALAGNLALGMAAWWVLTRRIGYCATGSVTRALAAMLICAPLALAAGLAGPLAFGCAILAPYAATVAIAAKSTSHACALPAASE